MKKIILLIINKRNLLGIAMFILSLMSYAQSQYDYYDDDAVAGGAGRALNGIIIIILLVLAFLAFAFIVGGIMKIYYWFNPEADPEYKREKAKEEQKKRQEELEQELRKVAVPQAIDLGLSVKWASFNIGAYKPNDMGSLFYWAENKPSDKGRPINRNINVHAIGDISGIPKYDAATTMFGKNWRIPTDEEFQELIDLCRWEKKTIEGVEGRLVIGANGNSIFLPYNQIKYLSNENLSGHYWSSIPHFAYVNSSKNLGFGENCKTPAEVWGGKADVCLYGIRPVFYEASNITQELDENEKKMIFEKAVLSTKVENDSIYKYYEEQCVVKDNENEFTDQYGVKYSIDKKKLLNGDNCNRVLYEIKEGTEFICNDAFNINVFQGFSFRTKVRTLEKLILPSTLIWFPTTAIPNNCKIVSHSKYYSVIGNLIIDNRKRGAIKCLNKFINNVDIYEPVEIIEDNAFAYCEDLESIVLPKTLKVIKKSAFNHCVKLKTIKLPHSLERIETGAFYCCGITEAMIPKQTIVEEGAFMENCKIIRQE